MNPINNHVIVKFDAPPSGRGGLILPERYLIQEGDKDGENNAYGVTTDRRLINPQVVTVIKGNQKVKTGSRYFVYYGAYEIAQWIDEEQAIIPDNTVYFQVDPIMPLVGFYLGEEVFTEGEKTASGIYTTPFAERKEGIKVKLTHVSDNRFKVGQNVITIDEKQYTLTYEGKKYIKLTDKEIIGIETDNGYEPLGTNLHLEYLPDSDLQERIAENDRRRERRDLVTKFHLHVSTAHHNGIDEDMNDLKEPTFVNAKVLFGKLKGQTVLVYRNFGCLLPDKTWIVGLHNVVGTVE